MTNTSLIGGYLAPNPTTPPLEGAALLGFLHDWIAGITGLDPNFVRPRWQPEPPNMPDAGEAWCAFGVQNRKTDSYPYVFTPKDTVVPYQLQRHEEFDVLTSFYDLGSGAQADFYAALLRDGIAIPQNREPLLEAGVGYVGVTDLVAVPSLLKRRWLYRVDFAVQLRRVIQRFYPVLSVTSEVGEVIANPPATTETITQNIDVPKGT